MKNKTKVFPAERKLHEKAMKALGRFMKKHQKKLEPGDRSLLRLSDAQTQFDNKRHIKSFRKLHGLGDKF